MSGAQGTPHSSAQRWAAPVWEVTATQGKPCHLGVSPGPRQAGRKCLSPSWGQSPDGLPTGAGRGASAPQGGLGTVWGTLGFPTAPSWPFSSVSRVTDRFSLPLPFLVGYRELITRQVLVTHLSQSSKQLRGGGVASPSLLMQKIGSERVRHVPGSHSRELMLCLLPQDATPTP